MDGDRGLSGEGVEKFIIALRLNKEESHFFRGLVEYNQARSNREKSFAYRSLLRSRKIKELKPIARDQYEYYSAWYHPVVRELVVANHFNGDLEELARRINPPVSVRQVERSIELLTRLGFISKNDADIYVQAETVVSTGAETTEVSLTNYHEEVLNLGKTLLDEIPQEKRDVSVLTLGMRKSLLPELKKKMAQFRSEILAMVVNETKPEQVVLLSMQLLPVTKDEDKNGEYQND